jgi:hypothetical protein
VSNKSVDAGGVLAKKGERVRVLDKEIDTGEGFAWGGGGHTSGYLEFYVETADRRASFHVSPGEVALPSAADPKSRRR